MLWPSVRGAFLLWSHFWLEVLSRRAKARVLLRWREMKLSCLSYKWLLIQHLLWYGNCFLAKVSHFISEKVAISFLKSLYLIHFENFFFLNFLTSLEKFMELFLGRSQLWHSCSCLNQFILLLFSFCCVHDIVKICIYPKFKNSSNRYKHYRNLTGGFSFLS